MRTCILSFCLVSMLVVHTLSVHAAPPDGVTFITELFGYQGEYYDYSGNTGYTWHPSLDVDTDGDLWICSTGHVFENLDNEWIDHTEASGGGDYVSVTSQGIVWVASSEHLASYDGVAWTDHSEGIPEKILALSAEGNNVWMGGYVYNYSLNSDDWYLAHFNGETVSIHYEGLLQDYISRLTATPDGVWIVYHNWYDMFDCVGHNCPIGTSFFDGSMFHHHSIATGMPAVDNPYWEDMTDVPWIVYSAREDRIYAICNNNLVTYENEQWTILDESFGRYTLIEGFDGNLWQGRMSISSGSGLSYKENNSYYDFDFSEIHAWIYNELLNEVHGGFWTYSVAVADNEVAWFGMTIGLVRIDTKQLSYHPTGIEADIPGEETPEIVCYPNPFNNSTSIRFELPETSKIEADIYSLSGQRVYHLSSGWLSAGSHALQWDGRNTDGDEVSSGMYFVTIRAGDMHLVGSMTFVK